MKEIKIVVVYYVSLNIRRIWCYTVLLKFMKSVEQVIKIKKK